MLDIYEKILKEKMLIFLTEMYINKNVDAVMHLYNPHCAIFKGMGNKKVLQSYQKIEDYLKEVLPQLQKYHIVDYSFDTLELGNNQMMLCGEFTLQREEQRQRYTFSSIWDLADEVKISSLMISDMEILEQENLEILEEEISKMITQEVYNSYQALDERYNEKSLQLEMLIKACGGGLAVMEYKGDYPFVYISDGLSQMLGYEQQEFLENCKHSFSKIEGISSGDILWKIEQQIQEKRSYQCEYKATHKNGDTVWIYANGKAEQDNDGNWLLYGIFIDITEQKNALIQLEIEHLHNQIVLEMSGDIVLDYNCNTDEITIRNYPVYSKPETHHLSNFRRSFRRFMRRYIYQDDRKKMMKFLMESNFEGSIEFRGKDKEKGYKWYRLTLRKLMVDKDEMKIVGRVHNIDDQKWLENEANLDDLTRLYNRRYMNQQMETILAKESGGALIMMDVDSFKAINDNFGHDEGDKVLITLASLLVKHFRKDDLVCRVGGDEFVVFMRNVSNETVIQSRCERLIRSFIQKTTAYHPIAIPSLSIGGVMVSPTCCTIEELYRDADEMLYAVKRSGKNGIQIKI